MDELEDKINILLKNKSHILRMPNNKKKVEMLEAYFSLLQYCRIVGYEEDERLMIDGEFTKKYERYVFLDTKKNIDELEINAQKLYDKYQQVIECYKENDFCKYEHVGVIKVNRKKMEEALWNFFTFLGQDVLKVYYKMIVGRNIYLNNVAMERLGYAMDSTPIDNACITVQNIPHYLDFYTTLAHEVGHCYQFYLQKNQRNYALFDPYCEITSMLFEKLFVEYLKNNHLIDDLPMMDLENHLGFLNNVSVSKMICKLFMEDKIGVINPFNLSYTCSVSEDDIKKEITDDCGYVKPFYFQPELTELHYSISNFIARYFMKKIEQDFTSGWKEFKAFICTVNYLPMEEVIDEYIDVDLAKENIKKLIKSYRER